MGRSIDENAVEQTALDWFRELGYAYRHGPEISPDGDAPERGRYEDVVLLDRLRSAVAVLNPDLPAETRDDAIRQATRPLETGLVAANRRLHRLLAEGVEVEIRRGDGTIAGDRVQLIDFENADRNDWLVVNQFTVKEHATRRLDVVVFVNGLPLAVLELKNPVDENATIAKAVQQLQNYKRELPALFAFNELLVASDGLEARVGSLTANRERFMPWRTIAGENDAPAGLHELEVVIRGLFDRGRLLEFVRRFVVFNEDDRGEPVKKIAAYHQFHAVRTAVEETIAATSAGGDRRCGVVWHTQGSGKSLTMAFYAGSAILHPAMENPTVVVLTDRNDLDDQLFGTFSQCHELLRQRPVQASDRADLRRLLQVASGGVVFTTIQKFFPEQKGDSFPCLSDRRNIVVIADEAHRSQYDFVDGFARHMRDALPHASFIGFTGTPIELGDKNTQAVFGEYISIYDIQQAVEDGATVRIYYESRLAKIALQEDRLPSLDVEFEEATEGEELTRKEKLKTKWAALESLVGSSQRLQLVARDLVEHFDERSETLAGKGMIVCMSRRICVDLYNEIVKLRPDWHGDDATAAAKIVMTGSASDPTDWQPHIRSKGAREELAQRFKDPDDPFRLVIVRDMWLTGFDAPCLHTMYVDKPMRGHGLMQAIARVNRVFLDKPGGLVVDYLGLASHLKAALANYTQSGGRGRTAIDQEEAVDALLMKYEVCCGLFHGFDRSAWLTGTPQEKFALLPSAQEHVLAQEDGKDRFLKAVAELTKAFALAVPHEKALAIRDDVGFFQAVRTALAKRQANLSRPDDELNHAISQLVSRAVSSDRVIDVFEAAGLKRPDMSILSEEFLTEVRAMPQKNLAVELLRKLLGDEIKTRSRKNLVQSRSFAEMLERSIKAYQNRAIEAAAVIEELIHLADEMREAQRRGEDLGLSEDEIAFYDALETSDSAVQVLGEPTLKQIAHELVDAVRRNVTIDWTVRQQVRAKMRVLVKRILRKYGYPPDKQEQAAATVMQQAELLCRDWAA